VTAAVRTRARLPIDERRAQLLDLGRRLFVQRPYEEISIDEIAAAAGISKGLLYHYFPSKRSFFIETVRAAAHELVARVTDHPADMGPEDRLARGVDAYLAYVSENAAAYRTLLTASVGVDAEIASILDRTRAVLTERILAELGDTPPPTLRVALRGWVGFVEGASLEWVSAGAPPAPQLRKLLVETLKHVLALVPTI
jgi:AcrR family transcriptional regulator